MLVVTQAKSCRLETNAANEYIETDERNTTKLKWTPGHSGIEMSAKSDEEAVAGAGSTTNDPQGGRKTYVYRRAGETPIVKRNRQKDRSQSGQ